MTSRAFQIIAGVVKERSGIVLMPEQSYLLETRLAALLQRLGLGSLDVLAARLQSPGSDGLAQEVAELLTTNESHFFRDGKPFDHVRAQIPRLHRARAPGLPLRFWSAACSTGQEAYSLAILIAEAQEADPALRQRRFEILGTDLTRSVLERARQGLYTQFEVQRGLPVRMLMKHFTQVEGRWRIHDRLRQLCRFEQANLLQDLRQFGRFDVIFCRNVLIYFDPPSKTRVLEALAAQLAPDGLLYLGAAETALGLTDRLEPLPEIRGVYRPSAAARRAIA
ncbi:MAG: protein-glutamate O-methyltransferase CheR [Rhodovarius sp.]|nr:protein-glutamate O-methyltransferase CheR [Rhodovarius sp.]MDW8315286.1 protein-glutamate O-methyltransferase CheR [Rhodovarius sp.]